MQNLMPVQTIEIPQPPGKPKQALAIDSRLKGLAENLWKKTKAVPDPELKQPAIDQDGNIKGDLQPPILPETQAEKWVMLFLNTHQIHTMNYDPDFPKALSIDEDGKIAEPTGFFFEPQTPEEKTFLNKKKKDHLALFDKVKPI